MALNSIRVRYGETENTSFTVDSEYETLPSGFIRARQLKINGNPPSPVNYVAPTWVDRLKYTTQNVGRPVFYTIQGNQLRVIPTPDSSYTATFTYYALAALSVSNTTNWLLTNKPKIYLTATMVEAYKYYQDFEKASLAQSDLQRMFDAWQAAEGAGSIGSALQMRTDWAP